VIERFGWAPGICPGQTKTHIKNLGIINYLWVSLARSVEGASTVTLFRKASEDGLNAALFNT